MGEWNRDAISCFPPDKLFSTATSLNVEASGASRVKAEALQVEGADVSISGASVAELRANTQMVSQIVSVHFFALTPFFPAHFGGTTAKRRCGA
jgi:hypothetical protein